MLIGNTTPIVGSDDSADILVNATAVVYTKAINISRGQFFGLAAKAVSATGAAAVKLELQESPIFTASLDAAADANFVEPDGKSDLIDIADENMHILSPAPVAMPWMRIKITGAGGNPADTIVNLWNFMQEPT
jgi:hypothetical protein